MLLRQAGAWCDVMVKKKDEWDDRDESLDSGRACDPTECGRSISPAEDQPGAILENHAMISVCLRLHLSDSIDVHDTRAMDTNEPGRVQPLLYVADLLTDEILVFPRVVLDVVSLCFDPIYKIQLQHDHATPGSHQHSLAKFLARRDFLKQRSPPIQCRTELTSPFADSPSESLETLVKSVGIDRLEEVIHRMNIKCFQCVLVVRGHENHGRNRMHSDGAKDFEPVDFGHLDIQEHQIGTQFPDSIDRRESVSTFADDDDILFPVQQPAETFSRERLIVHDKCPKNPAAPFAFSRPHPRLSGTARSLRP